MARARAAARGDASRGLELAPRLPVYPRVPRRRVARPGRAAAALRASDALGLAREDGWSPGRAGRGAVRRPRDALPLDTRDELGEDEIVAPLPRARRRARARLRGGRPAPPRGLRRRGQLRRHAEHPVHERLLLPLRLLRLLEGQARGEPARRAVPRAARGDRPPRARRRGSAARPRSACRAGSTRPSPATTTPRSSARSRTPCRSCTCMRSRRSRSGRARRRSASRSTTTSRGCATRASARCRARRPRSSTTRCGGHLPRQGHDRAVARGARRRAPRRPALERDDHVRPRRAARAAGRATCSRAREQQQRSGGFTEFVPLPFVHMEAPMYLQGPRAARADVRRDAAHARGRPARAPPVDHERAGLVGEARARRASVEALAAGVNDLGGTLMNESISRAAGSEWGQEMPPERMEALIRSAGRMPRQRTTLYGDAPAGARARVVRRRAARRAAQPAGAGRGPRGAAAARAARPARRARASAPRARCAGRAASQRGIRRRAVLRALSSAAG